MFEFFDERTYASVGENGLENVEMSDYPHHFTSSKAKAKSKDEEQEAWNLKQFQKVVGDFRFSLFECPFIRVSLPSSLFLIFPFRLFSFDSLRMSLPKTLSLRFSPSNSLSNSNLSSSDPLPFQKLKIEIINEDEHFLEFDLIGIDCSIANSFRRIMLAEVSF